MAKLQSGTTVYGNLIVNSNVTLGGGIYTTTGLYWAANNNVISTGGGGSSPVGVSGQIQYNNGGTLGAASLLYYSGNSAVVANAGVASTNTTSGSFQVIGGAGISGKVYTGDTITAAGNIVAASGTASTNTTTGALVVVGGVGVSGALNVGSTSSHTGAATFTSTITASGNIVAASGTASTNTTTGALVVSGGIGANGASNFGANLTVTGYLMPSANVTYDIGSSVTWWRTLYGISTQAKYADLAENYQADAEYSPGTVLVFGGEAEVTTTQLDHDPRVAGIVSTNPAHLMNGGLTGDNVIELGLTGRLPCKVQGPVTKGDVLVTSTTPGVAQKIDHSKFVPGCVIGKALENINTDTIDTIEVVVGRF